MAILTFEMKGYIKKRQWKNFIVKCIGWFSHRVDKLLINVFSVLPVRSTCIVFQSSGDFWDNAWAFYDYLLSIGFNDTHTLVWFVDEPAKYPKVRNVKFVRYESWYPVVLRDYYTATAKCFIFTHAGWLKKWRANQTVIHTTHSASQLKAKGINDIPSDFALCCGPDGVERKMIALNKAKDRLPILGMPRIDLLYKHIECIPKIVKDYHGQRVVLSMETFKQSKYFSDANKSTDTYAINVIHSKEELLELDRFLGCNDCVMLVKIHHLQDLFFLEGVSITNIIYLTDDDLRDKGLQLYQLLENADILLTDYSSVFYDFLLLDRPIGFLIGDIEEYSRGFIIYNPLDEMVGEKISTFNNLKEFLLSSVEGKDTYKEQRKMLRDRVFTYQDGNNCKRLLNWLQENKFIN